MAILNRFMEQFTECRISVSSTTIWFLSHKVSAQGNEADHEIFAAIAEAPFPTPKKGMQAFLEELNY